VRIDWNEWHGDPVIYRTITPVQLDWSLLPEIVVVLEPIVGERVVYNPYAGSKTGRAESESHRRITTVWQELYGRQPRGIVRTFPPSQVLTAYARALQSKGYVVKSFDDILELFNKIYGEAANSRLIPALRQMNPFGMESGSFGARPFLMIEDSSLFYEDATKPGRINASAWVNGSHARGEKDLSYLHVGKEPLVVYTGDFGPEFKSMLPPTAIFDSQDHPDQPYISWNYLKELTYAQGMHISMQPFLLRRYARRIATSWEKDYGRRPAVHALTIVSLNGRPFQQLVDPNADLATVSANWFHHNSWIRDLQVARAPRGGLESVGQ
jgi:hypothetical protein